MPWNSNPWSLVRGNGYTALRKRPQAFAGLSPKQKKTRDQLAVKAGKGNGNPAMPAALVIDKFCAACLNFTSLPDYLRESTRHYRPPLGLWSFGSRGSHLPLAVTFTKGTLEMSRISASALLGTVILAFSVAPNTAQACWGCCGPRVWYPGPLAVVTAWTPCWSTYDLCSPCDICVDPCCDVVDPCCDVEWVLGVRPGPIRRFLFGPYRWYPVVGEACTVCGAAPCDCGAQV